MFTTAIIILILLTIWSWLIYRDILCPAVLHNIMWIFSIAGVIGFNIVFSNQIYAPILTIIIGSIVFQFGFSLSQKTNLYTSKRDNNYTYVINTTSIKIVVIILVLIALPVAIQYYNSIKTASSSIYQLLKYADENMHLPALFDYYRRFTEFISIAFLVIYWKLDYSQRKKIKNYVIILTILALLCVCSIPTRNAVLWYMLPLFVAYAVTHSVSNKKIIITGIVFIVVFLFIFYIISLNKYWYLYDDGANRFSVISNELRLYLSGSIVAFCDNFQNNEFIYFGHNSFRLFEAIFDKAFGTDYAIRLTSNFVNIGNGQTTNVFSFYDFYLRDFGAIYAVFAQFVVSLIHGISYKKSKMNNWGWIYLYSVLSYPLIMQFFQDQYLSLLSTWIQITCVGVLVFKTGVFIKKDRSSNNLSMVQSKRN